MFEKAARLLDGGETGRVAFKEDEIDELESETEAGGTGEYKAFGDTTAEFVCTLTELGLIFVGVSGDSSTAGDVRPPGAGGAEPSLWNLEVASHGATGNELEPDF